LNPILSYWEVQSKPSIIQGVPDYICPDISEFLYYIVTNRS
jgi:hypothetical protein